MKLRDLMEKRASLVKELRQLNESPDGEGGDLSENQTKRFEVVKGELELVEKKVDRAQLVDEFDRRSQGQPIGSGDHKFDDLNDGFSLLRAIAHKAGVENVDAGREIEIGQELRRRNPGQNFKGFPVPLSIFQRRLLPHERERFEQRAVTTTTPAGGPGSNILGEDYRGDRFLDILRPHMVTGQLGTPVLRDLLGNTAFSALGTSAPTGWIGEGESLTPGDHSFKQVLLKPKTVGVLTEFSHLMTLQPSPDVEQLARNDFAASLARELDRAALFGGGTNEPSGILNIIDLGLHSIAGPTWDEVFALINAVEEANATVTGFAIRPTVKNALRTAPRTSGGGDGFIQMDDKSLAGYRAISSTLVGDGSIICGDWSQLLIGMWGAVDILVNPYADSVYNKGAIQVRGLLSADVGIRHEQAFAAAIDGPSSPTGPSV